MLHYFEIFTSCQGLMRTFSKHFSISNDFNKVQKDIARKETANIKIFTGEPTKQFFELFDF